MADIYTANWYRSPEEIHGIWDRQPQHQEYIYIYIYYIYIYIYIYTYTYIYILYLYSPYFQLSISILVQPSTFILLYSWSLFENRSDYLIIANDAFLPACTIVSYLNKPRVYPNCKGYGHTNNGNEILLFYISSCSMVEYNDQFQNDFDIK